MSERVKVYRDVGGQWRWSRLAANGRIISDSGEGYTRRWSAKRAAKRANPGIRIVVF